MTRNTVTGITLTAAAMAAVSIPLISSLLRADDVRDKGGVSPVVAPSTEPARPVRLAVASPQPASAPPKQVAESPAPTPSPAAVPASAPPAATPAPVAIVAQLPVAQAAPAAAPAAGPATAPAASAATQPATEPAGPPIRDVGGKVVDPEKVVITVGDEKVTAADFDGFISELPPEQQAIARNEGRREMADLIVKMKLLAQEAKSRNLDQGPRVRRYLQISRDQILAQAMVNDVKENLDDAAVRKYFEENKARLERVQARHILFRMKGSAVPVRSGQQDLTDDQAKARAWDVYKRLKAGADFAKIAREESDDTGSGADGGDLGTINRGRMVQPFEQAAFALKEGEIGQPVKSQFGWHVIQVVKRFDTPDKLAEQIRASLGPKKTDDLIADLKKSRKAEVDDSFFGPPLPPEPGAPGLPATAPASPK